MSVVAHFFMSVGGSEIHERLAHFFIDIYTQENNPKRTSKTALLNDKFSRAVFLLVLFIFPPRDIIFAFQAIVAGMGPVEFPFKILFPGDLPGV